MNRLDGKFTRRRINQNATSNRRNFSSLLAAVTTSLLLASPLPSRGDEITQPRYGLPNRLLTIADERIAESSGVACSIRNPNSYWTHNDSGDTARLFLVNGDGTTRGVYQLDNAQAKDWEDMASFTIGGTPYLCVGDVGDNERSRPHCTLYFAKEPLCPADRHPRTQILPVFKRLHYTYEDGPHNCESVAIDADHGLIFLVSKTARSDCAIYQLPLQLERTNETLVARKMADLNLPATTAMDLSPDGNRMIILSMFSAAEFERRPDENWASTVRRRPTPVLTPVWGQFEAICYGTEGDHLIVTAEGRNKTWWKLSARNEADAAPSERIRPLIHAHAHNDYRHDRPLHDALDQGFCSVEADVFLVDGELLVGHSRDELRRGRTIEKLYLDPLLKRARTNGGRIYRDGPIFTLLVDIKADGAAAYSALEESLQHYSKLVTSFEAGMVKQRAVTVIISGDRPIDFVAAQPLRRAAVDGRLNDLEDPKPDHLMPLISDRWTTHFTWRGKGEMPTQEQAKLQDIVERAHKNNQRVRFWATPESETLWRELTRAHVDLINTDDLPRLNKFLNAQLGNPSE